MKLIKRSQATHGGPQGRPQGRPEGAPQSDGAEHDLQPRVWGRREALRAGVGAAGFAALASALGGRRVLAGPPAREGDADTGADTDTQHGTEAGEAAVPARLLLLGDSMIAGGLGLYMAQDLERDHGLEVIRHGKSSTGLARPDFYDWIKHGGKLAAQHKPDTVACMFGGNDGQGLYMGRDADPKWIRYNDPAWTPEYRRRVNAFADAVTATGACLVWIGMPVMRPTKLSARVEHMNTIFRAEMAIRPMAHFVDVWRAMADDAGAYADHVQIDGKRVKVRASDGVHMNRAGAHYLADFVQPEIASRTKHSSAADATGAEPGAASPPPDPTAQP